MARLHARSATDGFAAIGWGARRARLFDETHPPVADEDMMTFLAGALRVRGQEILATTWTPFRQYPARDGIERYAGHKVIMYGESPCARKPGPGRSRRSSRPRRLGLLVVLTERIVLLAFQLGPSMAKADSVGTPRARRPGSTAGDIAITRTRDRNRRCPTIQQLRRRRRCTPPSCTPTSRPSPTACSTSTFGASGGRSQVEL